MTMINYLQWGQAESGKAQALQENILESGDIEQALALVSARFNMEGFDLKHSRLVNHYQGVSLKPATVAWLRFEANKYEGINLGGEHISATVDLENQRVMGFTCMNKELTGEHFVSHSAALVIVINFLQKVAPDLINNKVVMPGKLAMGSELELNFEPRLQLGNVEVHWIKPHQEQITVGGVQQKVVGMKVKMFIPSTGLWAWVVVDKYGNIETFERNVCWNFAMDQRETQMWLHDSWLEAQQIINN